MTKFLFSINLTSLRVHQVRHCDGDVFTDFGGNENGNETRKLAHNICIFWLPNSQDIRTCIHAEDIAHSVLERHHPHVSFYTIWTHCHRLRGSASPVLTATHHSYGSPRLSDFFFRLTPVGQTPQPILTQNGSNDVDSRKDDTFVVKIATFHTPDFHGP